VDDEDSRSSGLMQVNDGLYAEMPLWCAIGPIAHYRLSRHVFGSLMTARMGVSVGRLPQEKNSIGMSVPVPYRSDVYVCSKSCWLCLTVVY
jgi:hypothetical protein